MEGADAVGVPNWEAGEVETEISEFAGCLGMAKKKYNWYEFFAGGGMARLGLGSSWNCAFANEWCDKKARAYRAYFGRSQELKVQDVRSLRTRDLPGVPDLVWASFPCQDLSLAGSGAGLRGERSGTFAPFWNLIRGLVREGRKPRTVVLENVVGTITSHSGRDFETLLRSMSDSGYAVGPLVIDAVHFVPQSRPRLFIIATALEERIPEGLTSMAANRYWHTASLLSAFRDLPADLRDSWIWWNLPSPHARNPKGLSSIVEAEPRGIQWHSKEQTYRLISLMSDLNKRKLLTAQRDGRPRIGTIYKRTRPVSDSAGSKRVQRAEIRFDDISGCLRTPVGGSSRQTVMIVEGRKIRSRLLSPREAARLMGVPESYPVPEKYNDAYHLFGDGVVVPVVSFLERHLLRPLAQPKTMERVA